jgi:hypothetical protein
MWAMKKTLIITGLALGVAATGISASMILNGFANGEWDLPGLQQQVQHNTEQLSNHEARIQNAEANVKQLQDNTSVTPPTQQTVPTVATPEAPQLTQSTSTAAVATPASVVATVPDVTPTAPTFVSFSFHTDPGTCNEYETDTYSDGSTTTKLVSSSCDITVTK